MRLDGATRMMVIVGDPIAQVKSPAGITAALQDQGRNVVVVPVHVTEADLPGLLSGLDEMLPTAFVGCVITAPAVSPLVAAAREIGCPSSVGGDMFQAERVLMLDFLRAAG